MKPDGMLIITWADLPIQDEFNHTTEQNKDDDEDYVPAGQGTYHGPHVNEQSNNYVKNNMAKRYLKFDRIKTVTLGVKIPHLPIPKI